MVTQEQIAQMAQKIAEQYQPEKIILFGSYAQGTASEQSDIDLLIVIKNSELPRHKRTQPIRKMLWGSIDVPKDILVYTQAEVDEWKHVKEAFITTAVNAGKVLYEK